MKTFKDGDKIEVTIKLYAEIVTDLKSVNEADIKQLFFDDNAYGLKSIVAGKVDLNTKNTHDTEVIWDSFDLNIKKI